MKSFTVLENNPEVLKHLAQALGLSPKVQFHDVYSLTEPSLLGLIPRPCLALLVIIPLTPTWHALRQEENALMPEPYPGVGPSEPTIWFKQTIGEACGSIGLIHCVLNGPASSFIEPNSTFDHFRTHAIPLRMEERAQLLYDSQELEKAHQEAAALGDTPPPSGVDSLWLGHFVAFVKGNDGHLWELEGNRRGPIDRGLLAEEEDVLSEAALARGIGRYVKLEEEAGGGDLRFSCVALAEG